MFNEALYEEFRKTPAHKRYVIHCVIGAAACAGIGIALIALGFVLGDLFENNLMIALTVALFAAGAVCIMVPVGFIMSARHKPFLCEKGEITAVSKNRAEIRVKDLTVKKAVSYERFLRNTPMSNYSAGDEVVVISHDKKLTRPMFYK